MPKAGDEIEIGLIDLTQAGMPWQSLGKTKAWHWQAGCMLQWVPGCGEPEVCIWNDIQDGKFISRVLNPDTGAARELPAPVFTLSPDGTKALTIDFHRLKDMRPGYGYYGSSDPNFEVLAPANAGIRVMDLEGGESKLVVSLAEIATIPWPWGDLSTAKHYFNVLICNPGGTRFLFLHRWRFPGQGFQTRLVTCAMDGSDIRIVDDSGHTSHLIWKDDETILAWSRPHGQPAGFWLFPDSGGEPEPIGQDRMPLNGHCTYLPGGEWILNDTYPKGTERLQDLYLYHVATGTRQNLGQFAAAPGFDGELRCDLHPRSSRDGRKVVIDSSHAGNGRQMYLLDVSMMVG
ncbi:MAG: hypothetical protein OXH72_00700 [Caldilineaceae bacterium]|nr:hypothetical protein [Caldilineaceae bacterium]